MIWLYLASFPLAFLLVGVGISPFFQESYKGVHRGRREE